MASIYSLPPEILRDIFSLSCARYDLKNYFRINIVCKTWHDNTMNILHNIIYDGWGSRNPKQQDMIVSLIERNISSITSFKVNITRNPEATEKLKEIIPRIANQLKHYTHQLYSIEEIKLFKNMTRLESLSWPICMQRGLVRNSDFYNLTDLTRLNCLRLDAHCERIPTSNAVGKITTLASLTKLELIGINVDSENFAKFIGPMTNLQHCELNTCRNITALTAFHTKTNLTSLKVCFGSIAPFEIEMLRMKLKKLKFYN